MSRKILVVDEKLFMVRLIQHHLEKAGFELIKARNRQEAIDAIAQQSPELVLLDDCANPQPGTHEKHAAHSIPMIRMTDVPQNFEEEGKDFADVVLRKPFSPTHLVAEVKRLMPQSKKT